MTIHLSHYTKDFPQQMAQQILMNTFWIRSGRRSFEDEVSHRCGTNASGRHMLPNLMWLATTNTFNAMAAEV